MSYCYYKLQKEVKKQFSLNLSLRLNTTNLLSGAYYTSTEDFVVNYNYSTEYSANKKRTHISFSSGNSIEPKTLQFGMISMEVQVPLKIF